MGIRSFYFDRHTPGQTIKFMMMSFFMKSSFFTFVSILLLSSCVKDVDIVTNDEIPAPAVQTRSYQNVDPELWTFFERFEKEAALRGVRIDLNQSRISGEIAGLGGDRVAGQCTYHSAIPNHITIDDSFWEDATDLVKEMVIFHELGHCELGRDHRETQSRNGLCLSIMRSGADGCRDNYRMITRSDYLDELFDTQFFDQLGQ